jgi:peroxiredoxin
VSGAWVVAFVVLWLVVLVEAVLLLGTLRRISPILEQAESRLLAPDALDFKPGGLPPGTPVPEFSVTGATGGQVTRDDLLGESTILLFLSSDCPPCRLLSTELADLETAAQLGVRVVAVVDSEEKGGRFAERLTRSGIVIYQSDRELSSAFASSATPHAFGINADGVVVGSGTPSASMDSSNSLRC